MKHEERVEVLVVGAGPVGLFTALRLAQAGVGVEVIDGEPNPAARSYACVLHGRTLRLLKRAGLAKEVLASGRRIDTIAFYEGAERRAEIPLASLAGGDASVVTLPQSALEGVLGDGLKRAGGHAVRWSRRLSRIEPDGETVVATVDHLEESSKGYIVPDWDWTVKRRTQVRTTFLVGADGHESPVRQRLGIECEELGPSEQYIVYEFESGADPGSEVRIVMDDTTTSVLWPLPGTSLRWSFQLGHPHEDVGFPAKEREGWIMDEPDSEHDRRHQIRRLASLRAPWFANEVGEVKWSSRVTFTPRLAPRYGKGRCWLAGDAAHQTAPVGVQSMNLGFVEAEELAGRLAGILRGGASLKDLQEYEAQRRGEMNQLLGVSGTLEARKESEPWVKAHAAQILACLPASGVDLERLAGHLQLDFPNRPGEPVVGAIQEANI